MGILYGEGGNVFDDLRVARATYDFATHGGAVGTDIGLGVFIPNGAVVTDFITSNNTNFAGAGADVVMSIGTVEYVAATDFNNGVFTAITAHIVAPVKNAANAEITMDIVGAELTAGNYDIFVLYYMGTDINS